MRVFHDYNYFQREQLYIYQLDTFEIRNMSLHFVDNVALLVTVLVFKINALLWQHTHPQANQSANSVKRANHQFSKVSDTFTKRHTSEL